MASEETRAALVRELPPYGISLVPSFSVTETVERLSRSVAVPEETPDTGGEHSADVIILDDELGGQACAHSVDVLRGSRFTQPVIVLSGEDDPHRRAAVFEAGADRDLVAPVGGNPTMGAD